MRATLIIISLLVFANGLWTAGTVPLIKIPDDQLYSARTRLESDPEADAEVLRMMAEGIAKVREEQQTLSRDLTKSSIASILIGLAGIAAGAMGGRSKDEPGINQVVSEKA